eukprot:CAMPEP_0175527174 /NCGR_PEP_ID=MMETSP0096-20121207/19991_1 /TAXON_ID=311494 /ORGANISM="Alexandrium monilatum, Strain CCMP3105" /LENGTH=77 /DNA_ID=CAMNT_0016829819 /DNA_START=9 /DNA_END=240 /DNA_ORIENTATION=+
MVDKMLEDLKAKKDELKQSPLPRRRSFVVRGIDSGGVVRPDAGSVEKQPTKRQGLAQLQLVRVPAMCGVHRAGAGFL